MKRPDTIAAVLVTAAIAMVVAACGPAAHPKATADTVNASPAASASSAPAPAPSPAVRRHREHLSQPIALPSCPGTGTSPHFTTPEAAMRYLARAWNADNLDALCHVTNPNARFLLNDMHREAVNLRLDRCRSNHNGSYECIFVHDYPARMHKTGHGHAYFDVAPADRPGYYMTVFEGCG